MDNHHTNMKLPKSSLFIIALVLSLTSSFVHAQNIRAYSVFIYSFAKGLHWPETDDTANFTIGVMGSPELLTELQVMTAGKSVGLSPLVIKDIQRPEDLRACRIVFIAQARSAELSAILAAIQNLPVLLITEKDGLAKNGSGLNFIKVGDKLRFEYNAKFIEGRGIKMPSNLKTLGISVD